MATIGYVKGKYCKKFPSTDFELTQIRNYLINRHYKYIIRSCRAHSSKEYVRKFYINTDISDLSADDVIFFTERFLSRKDFLKIKKDFDVLTGVFLKGEL